MYQIVRQREESEAAGYLAGWTYGARSVARYGVPYAVHIARRTLSNSALPVNYSAHGQGWLSGLADAALSAVGAESF